MERGKDARIFVAGALTAAFAVLVGCKGQVQIGDEPGFGSDANVSSDATSSSSGSSGSRSDPGASSVGEEGGPGEAGPGSAGRDATTGFSPNAGEGGPGEAGPGSAGGGTTASGGYIDAGYYTGIGSFWVDGGAYPALADGSADDEGGSSVGDASSGCSALSACCETLSGSTQTLCNSVAGGSDATDCATELSQLESEGYCTAVTVVATQVQESPTRMVSDGTLLYWATFQSTPGLFAVPVGGGAVTTILSASVGNSQGGQFLAVDAENIYVLETYSLVRIPKDGSPATLVNEAGAGVSAATSLGGTAYWLEALDADAAQAFAVKSAPLQGGPVTTVAAFTPNVLGVGSVAVTSSTVFVNSFLGRVFYFPMAGLMDGGPMQIDLTTGYGSCGDMSSDTAAVYCPVPTGSDVLITRDGTTASLGATDNSSFIVSDDANVYWVDDTTVGYVKRAPKGGGGPVTILAQDTSPTAIAVDAHSVYWADAQGFIKSIPK